MLNSIMKNKTAFLSMLVLGAVIATYAFGTPVHAFASGSGGNGGNGGNGGI